MFLKEVSYAHQGWIDSKNSNIVKYSHDLKFTELSSVSHVPSEILLTC